MATENQKDVPPAQPPKIRLKGVPTGTARPVGAQPPPPDKKAETTRIAVEAAQPKAPDVPAAKAQTSKVVVELGREVERPDAKSQTARIDLSAAMPGSLGRQGAETARIDLAAARPAESDSGLRPAPAGIGDQAAKSATAYIDVPLTEVSPEAAEQAKAATMRVQVDEADLASVMGETQPIGATEATGNMVQDAAKKRTVKVDLASVLSEEAPDATAPVVLPKPGGGAPTAAQTRDSNLPRTIRLKRPGAAAPAGGGTEPTIAMEPDEGVEHSKSETARIDLPPDAAHPPTRQKTIRIKRPGGAAPGRQLTIARATGATDQPDEAREAPLDIPAFKRPGARVAPSRFDGLFGGLALVATLAACVVIYVLAAQLKSVALGEEQTPSWPFVGQVQ